MIQCPKCSADNSDDSRFCKSCGQEISSFSQAPTIAAPRVIPLKVSRLPDADRQPNWSVLFKAADLDQAKFSPVEPQAIPPVHSDVQAAWIGTLPDFPERQFGLKPLPGR